MGVFGSLVANTAQHLHVILISHVHDSECVFVVVEADLMALVSSVWARINHALRVVSVSGI